MEDAEHPKDCVVDLWLTRRCASDDLDLAGDGLDARARVGDHELIDAFVEKRSVSPEGQETITLASRGAWYTLHGGRWRGVTWHQRAASVVWLGGAGYHRDGDRSDAYEHIRRQDDAGRLVPQRSDVKQLLAWRRRRLAQELVDRPAQLVAAARAEPGRVVVATLADRISVRLHVDAGDPELLTVAIARELLPGPAHVPKDWVIVLLAAFFGEHSIEDLAWTDEFDGRPIGDEHCYCYFVDPA
ncbi:MAG: hypothetical protein KDC46_00360 [Thermoleophilia bacterium]|nr:hypothetical protein [Thermoleophilia bacterium]